MTKMPIEISFLYPYSSYLMIPLFHIWVSEHVYVDPDNNLVRAGPLHRTLDWL